MKKSKNQIINEIIDQEQDVLYEIGPYTKKLFRTNYNNRLIPSRGEVNNDPSMTIPGQSYTIKEILERFTNGQSLNIQKTGSYQENPDFDDITLNSNTIQDLTDFDEVITLNKNKINLLSAELDAIKTKRMGSDQATREDAGRPGAQRTYQREELSPSGSEQLSNTSSHQILPTQ